MKKILDEVHEYPLTTMWVAISLLVLMLQLGGVW